MPAGRLWSDVQQAPDARWAFLVADRYERSGCSPWAYVSLFVLVLSAGTLTILTGSLWGLLSAYRTARVITHDNHRDTLDLLAITPVGAIGVYWLIFKLIVHHEIDLGQFEGLRRLGLSVLGFPLALFILIIGTVALANPKILTGQVLVLLAVWIALVPIVYLDPLYGLMSGGMVALLVATWLRSDAYLAAMCVFLLAHLGITLVSLLPAVSVLWWGADLGVWGLMGIPLGVNALYICQHEALIWGLRRGLQRRLGSDVI